MVDEAGQGADLLRPRLSTGSSSRGAVHKPPPPWTELPRGTHPSRKKTELQVPRMSARGQQRLSQLKCLHGNRGA